MVGVNSLCSTSREYGRHFIQQLLIICRRYRIVWIPRPQAFQRFDFWCENVATRKDFEKKKPTKLLPFRHLCHLACDTMFELVTLLALGASSGSVRRNQAFGLNLPAMNGAATKSHRALSLP